MPQPAQNPPKMASRCSSARNNESGEPPDPPTLVSHENAPRNSNTRASRTCTSGRTSDGGHTAPRTAHDPAPSLDCLAEICSECECYLRPEEKEANEHNSPTRRELCDEHYRQSPAPIAPMGGPSYNFGTSFRARGTDDRHRRMGPYKQGNYARLLPFLWGQVSIRTCCKFQRGGQRSGQDLGRCVVHCGRHRRSCHWCLSEKHACSSSAVHSREKHVWAGQEVARIRYSELMNVGRRSLVGSMLVVASWLGD